MKVNSISSFRFQNNIQSFTNVRAFKTPALQADSVSFKGEFTYNYINKRGSEIFLNAMEVQTHARNVELEAANQQTQAAWLKDCAIYEFERVAISKDGKINHSWGAKDVEVLSSEMVDGRILPRKIAKYNADGDIHFEAVFSEGRISQAFVHNFDGSKDVFEFDKTGKLSKMISAKTPTSFDREYVYNLANSELLNYKAGYKLQEDGKKTTKEIMTFSLDDNDKAELVYCQKDRVQYLGEILEVGNTYFFDDFDEFSFQEGYKKSPNGVVEQGETFVMDKTTVQEYEQGFKQLEDGTKIHLPKMRTAHNGCVVELLDYGYSEKPNGEIERQNRVEMQGGIYHTILRMFGFLGE